MTGGCFKSLTGSNQVALNLIGAAVVASPGKTTTSCTSKRNTHGSVYSEKDQTGYKGAAEGFFDV